MARKTPPAPPEEPVFADREVAPVEEYDPAPEAAFEEDEEGNPQWDFHAQLGARGFGNPHPERTRIKKQVESTPIAACAVPDAAAWLVEKLNKDTSEVEHVGNAPLEISHRAFIRRFIASMPAEGEESAEFYLTPVDKSGALIGQPGKRYVTHAVPWDNVILQDIRARMPQGGSGESIAMRFLQDQLVIQREEAKAAAARAEAAEERARKAHDAALAERLGHANALKEDIGQAYQGVQRVQQDAFTGLLKTREETAKDERDREERREKERDAVRKEEMEARKAEAAERLATLKVEADTKAKQAQAEADARSAAVRQEAEARTSAAKAEAADRLAMIKAEAEAKAEAAKAEAEAAIAAAKAEADTRAQAAEKAAAERRAEINAEVEKAKIAAQQERDRWEKDQVREDQRRKDDLERREKAEAAERERRDKLEAEERRRQDEIRLAREKLEAEERARREAAATAEQNRQREWIQQIETMRQDTATRREAAEKADRERRDAIDAADRARREKADGEEKERQREHQRYLETLRTDALKADQQRLADDRIRQEKASDAEEKRRQEHMQIMIAQIEKRAADGKDANPLGVIGTLMEQFGISPGNIPSLIEKIKPFFGGDAAAGLGTTIAAELGKTLREVIKRLPTTEEMAAAQEEGEEGEEEEEEEEDGEEAEETPPRRVEQRNTPPLEDYLAGAKRRKAEADTALVKTEAAEVAQVAPTAPPGVSDRKQVLAEERAGRAAMLALVDRIDGIDSAKWGEAILGGDDVDAFVRWVSRVGLDAAMEEAEGVDIEALAKVLDSMGVFEKGVPRDVAKAATEAM